MSVRARRSARPARPGRRLTALAALALGLQLLGACAPLLQALPGEQRGCWPRFPYEGGWLGGDAAYSVPMSGGRSLWLFGDTFVGAPGALDRRGAHFVNNSIGISRCSASGEFRIRYRWGRAPDGTPRAFVEHAEGGWWWILGGFFHGGSLYLGLLEVEHAPPRGPLGLPVRLTSTALARIDDPGKDPEHWRPRILPLSRGGEAWPLSALVVGETHLHLFAFLDRGDGRHPRILARLPLRSLDAEDPDLPAALETLERDGAWRPGLEPGRALILMDDDATEMSVHYHPALRRFVAVYSHPDARGTFPPLRPADAVQLRSAERLEGPWSAPRLVFRVPELAPEREPAPDPHTACYAAKAHPQFSRPGSLTFTYVCNLFAGTAEPLAIFHRMLRSMDIYRPVAATVTWP